jgi:hypothetical protein
MAFTKIEQLNSLIASLPDRVTGQAVWLKAYFDANPTQIMEAFNALVGRAESGDGGGSDRIQRGGWDQRRYGAGGDCGAEGHADAAVTGRSRTDLTGRKIGDGQVGESKLTAAVQGKLNGGHAHGSLTSDGKIGRVFGRVVVTGENGAYAGRDVKTRRITGILETGIPAAPSGYGHAGTAEEEIQGGSCASDCGRS